jgi:RimJ/RimL family protein N-acetyltransferase
MPGTIRPATAADHLRIVAVVDDWWGGRKMSGLLPSLFLEHFADTSLVADDDAGQLAAFLVGFVSQDDPTEAYVHFVGVRPDQRGTGLGRELHDRFAATVAPFGVRVVRCVTSTLNTASVAFHTSIGFTIDGETTASPSAGADDDHGHVLLSRRLDNVEPTFRARFDARPDDVPWPTATWPPAADTVLTGRWVELRPATPADGPDLAAALDIDEAWTHLARFRPDAATLAEDLEQAASVGRFPWLVTLRRDLGDIVAGGVVGTSSYLEISPNDARLEIGWTVYAPAVWGTAVNPECKLLLLGFAFDGLHMGRVQLKTDIRNERSQRAIARLGATYEGTLRRYQRRRDGSVRDTVLFSITAEEWPDVRDRLVRRLSTP